MTLQSNTTAGSRAQRPASSSLMSLYAKPVHKRAARALGYALTLNSAPAWLAASTVWQARLTPLEMASLTCAAYRATDPTLARAIPAQHQDQIGPPLPAFVDVMADANWWAGMASPDERAAYAVACFNRFSQVERAEFREFVRGRG